MKEKERKKRGQGVSRSALLMVNIQIFKKVYIKSVICSTVDWLLKKINNNK